MAMTRRFALAVVALACAGAWLAGTAAAAPPADAQRLLGRWTGAKLRCQKEEGKLVRCGTPASFEITFAAAGAGTTPDESLPKAFTWRFVPPAEIFVVPAAGGDELKLFGVDQEDPDSLTFQAYMYQPTEDPNAPAESRYIHYVFDVTRAE
jgi:hypothetical protein